MQYTPKRTDYEQAVRQMRDRTPAVVHLGIVLDTVKPGRVIAHVHNGPNLEQQNGYVHAGLLATLADSACGYAAYSLMDKGEDVLSVNMNVSLMRPADGSLVRAEGRVVKAGNRVYFTEAEVYSEHEGEDKLVVKASIVMAVVTE